MELAFDPQLPPRRYVPRSRLEKAGLTETQERWFDKLALTEAIQSLSERERLIVILRYFRDQTQSEVASRLGISQVQVSRLEKKILQSIKEQIAQ